MLLIGTLVGLSLDQVLLTLPVGSSVGAKTFILILAHGILGLSINLTVVIASALSALISHFINVFRKYILYSNREVE